MAFKLNFLRDKKDAAQERKVQSEDSSRLPLEKAAELYFNWKAADISPRTIAREKRLFKSVEKVIGGKRTVPSIDLQLLEEYQEERRKFLQGHSSIARGHFHNRQRCRKERKPQ